MAWNSFKSIALSFLCVSTLSVANAYADVPLPLEVHTVASATSIVPAEHTFTVSLAGTYQLTLTDFGASATPAVPMNALKLIVTSGATKVGTELDAAGTMTFPATPGDYVIHLVGTAGGPGSGQIGIHINDSTNTATYDFNDALALPPDAIPNGGSGIDDTFTVPTSGNFQVTLSDLQLPQALNTLTLALVQEGGALVTTLLTAGSTSVALQSGVNYRIFAIGSIGSVTPPPLNAGLFGVSVTPAGSTTPVYAKTVPVGAVTLIGSPMLTAGSYSLNASDLQFPSALSQFGVAVALNGQAVVALNASGTQTFTAIAATYQVFALGVAPAAGMGSYSVAVQSAQGPALSVARAVVDPASTARAYSFDATAASGQTYAFDLADFGYPAQFLSLKAAVVQAGTLVTGSQLTIGTSGAIPSATGTVNITPAAGPLSLLVFAQPAASTATTAAAGLFGIDLTVSGAAPVFETTQGVGQLFSVRKVSILTAGSYAVTVGDVGFPAVFQNLAAIVTRGTSRVGSIYGGGTFGFPAVVGDYYVNFVAQPTGTIQAGTYSMLVETAPAPTLTFTSDVSSVTSGGTVTLNWTGGNVASCTASNGWSGSKPASGQFTSGALTATTTFALSCDGPGGTAANSVTVTVTDPPAPAKSGGGGGAIRPELLVFLLGVMLLRRRMFSC
jgi:hypothetical protein